MEKSKQIRSGEDFTGIGKRTLHFQTIDSTNTFLKDNAHSLSEGTVVYAETQVYGRGRGGKKWYSPQGKGLYFSILLKPQLASEDIPLVSLMTSLALKRAIEGYAEHLKLPPRTLDIKWPNDLLYEGEKFAGILIESVYFNHKFNLIVGIGLNVSQEVNHDSPPELRGKIISLEQIYGGKWNRSILLKRILSTFDHAYRNFNAEKIVEDYRLNSRIWGKLGTITIPEGALKGICQDITPRGELVISMPSGNRTFINGSLTMEWQKLIHGKNALSD